MRGRLSTTFKILGICVAGGLIFAVMPVILEYAGLRLREIPASPRIFMVAALPPYLLVSGVCGLLLGAILSVLYSSGVFSGITRTTLNITLSSMLAGWSFFVGGATINIVYLPQFESLRSLAANLGLVAGFLAVGYGLYRFFGFLSSRISPLLIGGGTAAVLLASAAIFYSSSGMVSSGDTHSGRRTAKGPNVVLVLIDALRADHLSCLGYRRQTSPFLDKLAKQGALFTNFVSNSSWTRPSVATLFTSLYPSGHHATAIRSRISEKIETLPEIMRKNGYVTGLFTNTDQVGAIFGFGQGVDHYYMWLRRSMIRFTAFHRVTMKFLPSTDKWFWKLEKVRLGEKGAPEDKLLAERFLSWREELGGKPYFAYLHFMATHTPYNPPPPYHDKFLGQRSGKTFKPGWFHDIGIGFNECDKKLPDDTEKTLVDLYDGEIAFIDDVIKSLVNALYAENSSESMLIITADHGESFYEHCQYEHGHSLYQENLWVPTIIYYPGKVPKGLRISHPASTIDIAPTILSLAGLPPEKKFMGESLEPLLHNENEKFRPFVYSELLGRGELRSIIDERGYKLIELETEEKTVRELYDLNSDPGEERNLFHDDDYAEVRKGLEEKLSETRKYASLPQFDEIEVELDPGTKERLKALGYLK